MTHPASQIPANTDTIGYSRVSTEQQAGEMRTSLVEQPKALREHALRLGRVLHPLAIFVDAGFSGATAEGRPAFMALVDYCQSHPRVAGDGVVLVLNDSRWGRFDDPMEASHWQFVIKKLGWVVRFAEGDDVADGLARNVMRLVGNSQASEYRANLKRTAARASRATAEQGRWQNRAPIGFRRLATRLDGVQRVLEAAQRKSEDEVTRLTPGPSDEQEMVRFVFEAYASGKVTLNGLARLMAERWPGKQWSLATLNAMLKNPAYVGDVVWCRRPHDKGEQKKNRVRPREEWVVVVDAHPSIVSRDLFAQVAARLTLNKKETRATAGGYPLSGLISCATCGAGIVGGGGRRGPATDPDRYRFYRDGSAFKPINPCPGTIITLRKRWVEPTVLRAIAEVVSDARVQQVIVEELDRALTMLFDDTTTRRRQLTKEKEQLLAKRGRVVDAIAAGTLSSIEAAPTVAQLRSQIAAAEAELERLQFAERRAAAVEQLRDRMIAMAADFAGTALKAGGSALRELVRPWLASAVVDKETRILTLKIRRVPDMMGFPVLNQMARASGTRELSPRHLIATRRIRVPDMVRKGSKHRRGVA